MSIFKPGLEYMTKPEMQAFKKMVVKGEITFFKISECETCGEDIIKGKRFCSKKCVNDEESEYEEEEDYG